MGSGLGEEMQPQNKAHSSKKAMPSGLSHGQPVVIQARKRSLLGSAIANPVETPRVPWNQRPLPTEWSEEEVQFFSNWRNSLKELHAVLIVTASDRLKLLRRARNLYFKLAYRLANQIREAVLTQPKNGSAQNPAE
jgi:hypothetical protein